MLKSINLYLKVSTGNSSCHDAALYGPNIVEDHGNSNNNSNIEAFQASKSDKKKFTKTSIAVACHIEVTLEGKTLWDEFYCRGTEMIVNRAGR